MNVCSGHHVNLTCTATRANLLRWTSEILEQNQYTVQSTGIADNVIQQLGNSTTITIMRVSGAGEVPLVSTLVISSVTDDLNGTEVTCIDLQTFNSSSATINVIDSNSMQG